ncbi:hypothetical protein HRR83_005038 [Exophiala dermatitidis]|uniref:Ubiquitin-like domain-containing protein n=2 Tax=Exophiala dermatitidis TaxID=5970 RepID=H6C387_EXODN|nr:uncharacterized protein HMPREF1120_06120 [Exophiala dermatitidis NIH/UT8656]KAJ4517048.1 hypothetical protein HRR74_004798 [Exophiala dermatitidis]EHY58102.1 hypothetical protein HMPREF1120_06120 [Exophiala dermatitidis NIH/UT8656]KAJ4519774.1 hypothetical protein HRR73_003834 [Exophiala dermatitidis]KAJ4534423.1 hypothetical protein HRR76_006348 [Exophiala dermatitidis]KAJ4541355.1 hypothetical protein HRR77_006152 [Exophiala dermatitidis]
MSLRPPAAPLAPHAGTGEEDENEPDLELTIRFSASLPDLVLTIPGSESLNANTATLKQLIRSHVPQEYANRRIRLIHAGKALVDEVPLSASLKRNVSRPPSRISTPGPYDDNDQSSNGNGSARSSSKKTAAATSRPPPLQWSTTANSGGSDTAKGKLAVRDQPRIYIHCSIGDIVLSPGELAAEAAGAAAAASRHDDGERDGDGKTTSAAGAAASGEAGTQASRSSQISNTTTPAPRGFDRLLNAGFTPAEVQSLRLQFLAIQAHTHTPDTMPSPNTLRDMEDRWLDNSSAGGDLGGGGIGGAALGGAGGAAGGGEDDLQVGALDDMIWGTAMGFFWPIGCLMWGVREEGIWSQRRKMAVVVGFMLNVGLGIIRYTG